MIYLGQPMLIFLQVVYRAPSFSFAVMTSYNFCTCVSCSSAHPCFHTRPSCLCMLVSQINIPPHRELVSTPSETLSATQKIQGFSRQKTREYACLPTSRQIKYLRRSPTSGSSYSLQRNPPLRSYRYIKC